MDAQVAFNKPSKLLQKSRKLHRWLMAFVGVQVLIWAASGLYMVLPNIHFIHGENLLNPPYNNMQSTNIVVSFADVLKQYPSARNLRLSYLGAKPVYRFTVKQHNPSEYIIDAITAERIEALSKKQILDLIPSLLNENQQSQHRVRKITLLSKQVPAEISSRALPLWQVELDTWNNITLYVSAHSGEVAHVRHDAWRFFDLMWRLHIMDYTEGEDISNNLLAFSSIVAFIAVLAGIVMLFLRLFFSNNGSKVNPDNKHNAIEPNYIHNEQNLLVADGGSASEKSPFSFTWVAKQAHKWLALLVFVQLLVWLVSGFILGRIDHSIADGKPTFANSQTLTSIGNMKIDSLVDINTVANQFTMIESITLKPILSTWVYEIQQSTGQHDYFLSQYRLIDAFTGLPFQIDKNTAEQLALNSYKKINQQLPQVLETSHIQRAQSLLPKEENPVWRISMNDAFGTQILIRANTGVVLAHHNTLTAWRKLLLKLHFMDYANEGSFNNIFIKLFALLTFLLSISGILWLLQLLKDRQFSLARLFMGSSKAQLLTVYESKFHEGDKSANVSHTLRLDPNDTLLDALLANNITIESICAGGGMCGKCVCQFESKIAPTQAEKDCLSKQQLSQNWRLACQHRVKYVDVLCIPSTK